MTPFYHALQLPLFVFKVCSRCDAEKLLVEFREAPTCKDGHRSYCKDCTHLQDGDYRAAHAEQTRDYHTTHRERIRQQQREYYYTNPQRRQSWREYRACYPERVRQQKRDFYARHAEQIQQENKERYQANPLKSLEYNQRRNARKRNTSVAPVSYERILARDGYWCYICEQAILPHHKIEFDHVIPLARGGAHCEDNIKPTHAQCNHRKHYRLLEEMTTYQRRGV